VADYAESWRLGSLFYNGTTGNGVWREGEERVSKQKGLKGGAKRIKTAASAGEETPVPKSKENSLYETKKSR